MKNILRVFKNDLNKIHNNVIAMIVIMGILVIPTLYAWFNIAASWDPYGSTDGLKIAVASEDAGYTSELIKALLFQIACENRETITLHPLPVFCF